jgi:hypothetical protein
MEKKQLGILDEITKIEIQQETKKISILSQDIIMDIIRKENESLEKEEISKKSK